MKYVDFSMNQNDNGTTTKYEGVNAVVLAIRNIILSREGNYPFTPKLGMNIAKYQFDILDDDKLSEIRTKLLQQINQYVPSVDNVGVSVDKVEEEINGKLVNALGISVSASVDGEAVTANYLLIQDKDEIKFYNEVVH